MEGFGRLAAGWRLESEIPRWRRSREIPPFKRRRVGQNLSRLFVGLRAHLRPARSLRCRYALTGCRRQLALHAFARARRGLRPFAPRLAELCNHFLQFFKLALRTLTFLSQLL